LGFDDINQLYRFIGSFPTDHIALSRALQIKTKNQKYLFEILHRNREAQPCIYRGEMVLGSPVNHSLQDYSLEEAMERRIFPVYIAPAVKRTKRLVVHKIKAEPVLIPWLSPLKLKPEIKDTSLEERIELYQFSTRRSKPLPFNLTKDL